MAVLTKQAASEVTNSKQPKMPHIIYLLVDDWGWANVGYHRNPPTAEVQRTAYTIMLYPFSNSCDI